MSIMRPRVYREPHPFFPSHPWRARIEGLSWPFQTWAEAIAAALRDHPGFRMSKCEHYADLYGRCMDCGMTWAQRAAEAESESGGSEDA